MTLIKTIILCVLYLAIVILPASATSTFGDNITIDGFFFGKLKYPCGADFCIESVDGLIKAFSSEGTLIYSGADLTTTFNFLMDYLGNTPATIKIACGTYTISSRLSNTKLAKTIIGESKECTIIQQTANTTDNEVLYDYGGGSTYRNLHLINDGTASNVITNWGWFNTFDNLILDGGMYGIVYYGQTSMKQFSYITNNYFKNSVDPYGAIYIYNTNNTIISGNTLHGTGYRAITLDHTINNVVSNNYIHGYSVYGVQLFYADYNLVQSNYIYGQSTVPLAETPNIITLDRADGNVILGNYGDTGRIGIYIEDSLDNTIVGNTMRNMAGYNERLSTCAPSAGPRSGRGAHRNIFSGNTFVGGYRTLFPTIDCLGYTQGRADNIFRDTYVDAAFSSEYSGGADDFYDGTQVTSGQMMIQNLAGSGTRAVCADANGRIVIC